MASLTDHQLIQQIQLGQSEALGQLFDRYGGSVYDFLARVVGDSDEAAHLLVDVFTRFPQVASGIPEHGSVRGALFALARESALSYLRQKGWLESLPPSAPLGDSTDLGNDIWQAARAMPASQRAALAIEEHQALSPTEKATALGVVRHALPDVVAQARRSFNTQFDLRAQAQGKPTSALVNAERVPGLQRRVSDPNASLFTFLPLLVLTDTAYAQLRNQIVAAMGQPRAAVVLPPEPARAPQAPLPPPKEPSERERSQLPLLIGLGVVAAFLVVTIAVLVINGEQQTTAADIALPVIKQVEPQDGAILPPGKRVVVQAIYGDDRKVDVKTVRLILDGRDVTPASTVSDTSISYEAALEPGQHIALIELKDPSGKEVSRTWRFTISAPTLTSTPGPTATNVPTSTPMPTATNAPTSTPVPTATNAPTSTPVPTATNAPTSTPVPTATRTPEPALPDLVVTDISLSPNAEIVYVIRNGGTGDVAQPFLVQVLVDGSVVDSHRRVSSLGTGQEISLFVPNYNLAGTHIVTVIVNSDQAVKESNYSNNELIRTLSGPMPTQTPLPAPK